MAQRIISLPTVDPFDLDTPLLHLSKHDRWTIRDACEGVQIFGAIGSGKTSGSGAAIARAYLRAGFGGLVMCAKPEERRLWERYAVETGRKDDLIIVSPMHSARFNFLDYELRRKGAGGGLTENVVNLINKIIEIAEGKVQSTGGEPFWRHKTNELIRNAVDMLKLAYDGISLESIYDFIHEAPQSPQDVDDSYWQEHSFTYETIYLAQEKIRRPGATAVEQHDFHSASRYWLNTFAAMDERTRSNIQATFTGVADLLLHGTAWELLCTTTTIVPELTYKIGSIIVLDLPIQEYHEVGRIVQGIFKYMFQRAIVQRDAELDSRPVFLWADEAQNFVGSYDYLFQSVARSARACTVYLTQNINNYFAVLGANAKADADSLLGNLNTKIFHANTDHVTNTYASDTIAQVWTTQASIGRSDRGGSTSTTTSKSVQYQVLPSVFTRLMKGGNANRRQVEAIIMEGGRVWQASEATFIKACFTQQ